jgi:hypothetical protein
MASASVGVGAHTAHVRRLLPQRVPGGQSRLLAAVLRHNQRPVPLGVRHDVEHPIAVTVTLHWETGTEQLD